MAKFTTIYHSHIGLSRILSGNPFCIFDMQILRQQQLLIKKLLTKEQLFHLHISLKHQDQRY
ncbi:MAG: hypothetical protein DRH17_06825 [Deltaproteobacteria bacterium]|nr:MAG: hypothetical protein DRH17_06825 [Deltaproteobacteria bacterium]